MSMTKKLLLDQDASGTGIIKLVARADTNGKKHGETVCVNLDFDELPKATDLSQDQLTKIAQLAIQNKFNELVRSAIKPTKEVALYAGNYVEFKLPTALDVYKAFTEVSTKETIKPNKAELEYWLDNGFYAVLDAFLQVHKADQYSPPYLAKQFNAISTVLKSALNSPFSDKAKPSIERVFDFLLSMVDDAPDIQLVANSKSFIYLNSKLRKVDDTADSLDF